MFIVVIINYPIQCNNLNTQHAYTRLSNYMASRGFCAVYFVQAQPQPCLTGQLGRYTKQIMNTTNDSLGFIRNIYLSADIQGCASLLMSILFSLGRLPAHPQNLHSWSTSLSLFVWLLSYGLSGLGGLTRNIKFPPA
jgi:hypothetical protein